MSPLFVSVHATDIEVRTRMLGIKRKIDVLALLGQLAEAGIELHTQVVLCPGWNDGAISKRPSAIWSSSRWTASKAAAACSRWPSCRSA